MPFRFLRYLQPTRYFSVPNTAGAFLYPKPSLLPDEIRVQLKPSQSFTTPKATDYDLSWQALNLGYIGDTACYTSFEKLPVVDEYIFIKRYFSAIWVYYVFFIRLLSFKNPFREIKGLLASRSVSRSSFRDTPLQSNAIDSFESKLLKEMPKVSVIIPTLNRYPYLKDVLEDLEDQDYANIEVIVVDQSDDFSESFYTPFQLDLKLKHQTEKALWLARNTAIEMATGEYLLFFDDDSRVGQDWVTSHLQCIEFYKADGSSGVSLSAEGDAIPAHYAYYRIADQLDTGNVLLKKDVFRSIGMFDRQFEKQRMGDGEFGMRMYMHGFKNISNPKASRVHLKVGTGGLRQMGSWDAFRTNKLFAPRPIPSVLYFFRRYFGNKQAFFALLKSVPPSIIPYRFKKNKKLLLLGIFVSVLLLPFIMIQVMISWSKASKKINEGPLIRELH